MTKSDIARKTLSRSGNMRAGHTARAHAKRPACLRNAGPRPPFISWIYGKSARRQLRSIRETPNPNQNATVLDNIQVRGAADEMKLRPEIVQ